MMKENLFDLAKDPKKTYGPPLAKETAPFLNFSSLENALVQLKNASEEFQKLYSKATQLSTDKRNQLNAILYKAERSLMLEKGLPRRNWFRHQIYAPGYYTGYGVKHCRAFAKPLNKETGKKRRKILRSFQKH